MEGFEVGGAEGGEELLGADGGAAVGVDFVEDGFGGWAWGTVLESGGVLGEATFGPGATLGFEKVADHEAAFLG